MIFNRFTCIRREEHECASVYAVRHRHYSCDYYYLPLVIIIVIAATGCVCDDLISFPRLLGSGMNKIIQRTRGENNTREAFEEASNQVFKI